MLPLSVLLVEDDEGIRTPLAQFLEGEGYRVALAENGREALDWLKEHDAPGLILLDLMMPVMSGGEFLNARRSSVAFREIPVVLLTAWLHRWPESAYTTDGTLPKPIDTDKLLAIVSRYCDRSLIS